jgi:hypothetical protein
MKTKSTLGGFTSGILVFAWILLFAIAGSRSLPNFSFAMAQNVDETWGVLQILSSLQTWPWRFSSEPLSISYPDALSNFSIVLHKFLELITLGKVSESPVIFLLLGRVVVSFSVVASIIFLGQTILKSKTLSFPLPLFFIYFFPTSLIYATTAKPDALGMALIICSITFIYRSIEIPDKAAQNLLFSALFIGAAVGTKFLGLTLIPLFVLCCVYSYHQGSQLVGDQKFQKILNLSALIAVIAFSTIMYFVSITEIYPITVLSPSFVGGDDSIGISSRFVFLTCTTIVFVIFLSKFLFNASHSLFARTSRALLIGITGMTIGFLAVSATYFSNWRIFRSFIFFNFGLISFGKEFKLPPDIVQLNFHFLLNTAPGWPLLLIVTLFLPILLLMWRRGFVNTRDSFFLVLVYFGLSITLLQLIFHGGLINQGYVMQLYPFIFAILLVFGKMILSTGIHLRPFIIFSVFVILVLVGQPAKNASGEIWGIIANPEKSNSRIAASLWISSSLKPQPTYLDAEIPVPKNFKVAMSRWAIKSEDLESNTLFVLNSNIYSVYLPVRKLEDVRDPATYSAAHPLYKKIIEGDGFCLVRKFELPNQPTILIYQKC